MEQIKNQSQNEDDAEVRANVIETCDSVFWYSFKQNDEIVTNMTFLKAPAKDTTKIKPTVLGFKYNILLFRTPNEAEKEGAFSAIIGDPKGYAEQMGKLGFHGIMLKQDLKLKKELRKLLEIVLMKLGFTEQQVKKALKEATH